MQEKLFQIRWMSGNDHLEAWWKRNNPNRDGRVSSLVNQAAVVLTSQDKSSLKKTVKLLHPLNKYIDTSITLNGT